MLLSDTCGAVLLSGVAGYVDSAGFLALFGLFTAHITGDLVTAGSALADRFTLSEAIRLLMVPIFVVSVAATTFLARLLRRKGKTTPAPLLALMAIALAAFAAGGIILDPNANEPDSWAVMLVGATGVVAMGIQNTLMRSVFSSYSPTTIMTGNLTQCTMDIIEFMFPSPEACRSATLQRLRKFGMPLLAFMVGVLVGAYFLNVMGLMCIAIPALAVGALAIETWRQSTRAEGTRA